MAPPPALFITEKLSLLSHPLFMRPHRKDVSHESNPQAPGERDPYFIAHRLPREQSPNRIHNGSNRLIFGKSADDWRHRFSGHKRRTDEWQEEERIGEGAGAFERFRG